MLKDDPKDLTRAARRRELDALRMLLEFAARRAEELDATELARAIEEARERAREESRGTNQ